MSKQTEKISKMPIEVGELKKFFEENLAEMEKERYGLSWAGKINSKKEALTPTGKTLAPQKEESKNCDETENVFIEGDNLEALKLLQRKYFEKIKMIYIDPPYNTGKNFIYKDNFARSTKEELEASGEIKEGALLTTNARTNGRFHSDWLNMMYSRLFLAHKLLKDDGVIFVSIDDNEVANLRLLMDEIFGEENFVANIIWKRKRGRDNSAKWFSRSHEFLLVYAKNIEDFNINLLELNEETKKAYKNQDNDKRGNYRMLACWARGTQGGVKYEFVTKSGQKFKERLWLMSKENLHKLDEEDKLIIRGDNIYRKLFLSENKGKIPETIWDHTSNAANASDEIKNIFKDIIFDTPKPIPYIQEILKIVTNKSDDIILDFFAGSGTTAHAVMDLNAEDGGNRKYILVQLDEEVDKKSEAGKAGYKNIAEIARERIRRAGEKILKDKEEELKKREEPLDIGFRSFKITNSNYRQWEAGDFDMFEEKLLEQAKLFVDKPLVDNYKKINVVFESVVKEGFALSSKVVSKNDGNFWETKDGERKMIVDFGDKINPKEVEKLNLNENDIFICFDSALTDNDKINLSKSVNIEVV